MLHTVLQSSEGDPFVPFVDQKLKRSVSFAEVVSWIFYYLSYVIFNIEVKVKDWKRSPLVDFYVSKKMERDFRILMIFFTIVK